MTQLEKMKELNILLRKASKAYYQESREIMSNHEYDKLYDELEQLENETGIILSDSVTQTVGYEIISDLPKKKHPVKMLSLDKTKDRESLMKWLGTQKGCLSYKLDGLTIVLHYQNGELVEAVTRGNGEVGEVVTQNAKFFHGIPKKIPFKNELILRGEALMTYENFNKVNEQISDTNAKYKNPRNLASGTIRQLDTRITAERGIDFFAFSLVKAEGFLEDNLVFLGEIDGYCINDYSNQLDWLESLGFQVVKHKVVTKDTILNEIANIEKTMDLNPFPSDGLVLFYEDVSYGRTLGVTSKFPKNGIAYKWKDETAMTTLREIEWSPSRTGLLNPVAIFDSVELEGTTVSRASVHNLSIIKDLKLNIGDEIEVFKSNMIIPQIAENHSKSLKNIQEILPEHCPVCHGELEIKKEQDAEVLICKNPKCLAKHVGKFEHFVSRDAMNIIGLSSANLLKFIELDILHDFKDIYHLKEHKDKIVVLEGMGEKSYNNLIQSIEKSKKVELYQFLYSLGIQGIGLSTSKTIVKHFHSDIDKIIQSSKDDFVQIDGIGEILAENLAQYLRVHKDEILELKDELTFIYSTERIENKYENLTFVITGNVFQFKNRKELKKYIEDRGGKVSDSISSKTNYLINNNTLSTSGKNKKAKSLNIPIISEDEFLNL